MEGCKKIKKICDECESWIKLRRNPMVGFSIGRVFNEEIGVDVGELEEEKFMVLTDLATHYCQGSWIQNKTPKEIIKTVIEQ